MLKRILLPVAFPFVLLATVAAAKAIDDTFSFKRTAKEGQSAKYALKAKLVVQGMDVEAEGVSTETVKKVNEDGSFTVTSVQGEMTITFGGQTMNQPAGEESSTSFDAKGRITKIESKNGGDDAYRLAQLMNFLNPEKPVKVGEKWNFKFDADKEKSLPKTEANYELVSNEKMMDRDVLKVKFSVAEKEGETPASASGFLYLDAKTSLPIKTEAKWVNAPIQGQLMSGDVVVTLVP